MKTPLQLIEGHARLACLRGMIQVDHPNLRPMHDVWLATIPEGAADTRTSLTGSEATDERTT